jgi:hypothetical protein
MTVSLLLADPYSAAAVSTLHSLTIVKLPVRQFPSVLVTRCIRVVMQDVVVVALKCNKSRI